MPAVPPPQMLALDDETLARFVEAAASLQRLAIDAAWRDGVTGHLKAIAAAADLVLAFPLADEDEPSPVFTA